MRDVEEGATMLATPSGNCYLLVDKRVTRGGVRFMGVGADCGVLPLYSFDKGAYLAFHGAVAMATHAGMAPYRALLHPDDYTALLKDLPHVKPGANVLADAVPVVLAKEL